MRTREGWTLTRGLPAWAVLLLALTVGLLASALYVDTQVWHGFIPLTHEHSAAPYGLSAVSRLDSVGGGKDNYNCAYKIRGGDWAAQSRVKNNGNVVDVVSVGKTGGKNCHRIGVNGDSHQASTTYTSDWGPSSDHKAGN